MSYNLFLDDVRDPNKFLNDLRTWVVVRNYDQFVDTITNKGLPDFVSFDHDLEISHYGINLGDIKQLERTGYDCAKWLIEYCMKTSQPLPNFQIHSMNPVGTINISQLLLAKKERNL